MCKFFNNYARTCVFLIRKSERRNEKEDKQQKKKTRKSAKSHFCSARRDAISMQRDASMGRDAGGFYVCRFIKKKKKSQRVACSQRAQDATYNDIELISVSMCKKTREKFTLPPPPSSSLLLLMSKIETFFTTASLKFNYNPDRTRSNTASLARIRTIRFRSVQIVQSKTTRETIQNCSPSISGLSISDTVR